MAKTFNRIVVAKSNEVSLCSKYNSGANKQTEFELVKNKDIKDITNKDIKTFLKFLGEIKPEIEEKNMLEENKDIAEEFIEFLNWCLENEINEAMYNSLFNSLSDKLYSIKWDEISKEQKIEEFVKLFNAFVLAYKSLPITKNKNNEYEVSLVSKSRNQDIEINPQGETVDATKENLSKMDEKEQKTVMEKAIELIKNAFSLEKAETPADETSDKNAEEKDSAENKTPDVDKAEENASDENVGNQEETTEEKNEGEQQEATNEVSENENNVETKNDTQAEEIQENVEKSSEVDVQAIIKEKLDIQKQLDEMKKQKEEKEVEIEKMTFVQKAKDEFSMLAGTPEEIGNKLYSISKSNLCDADKDFIFSQLKKVSESNEELTKESGCVDKGQEDASDEDVLYAKAEELAKTKGISINKALREIDRK